jgi:hypothetical protein
MINKKRIIFESVEQITEYDKQELDKIVRETWKILDEAGIRITSIVKEGWKIRDLTQKLKLSKPFEWGLRITDDKLNDFDNKIATYLSLAFLYKYNYNSNYQEALELVPLVNDKNNITKDEILQALEILILPLLRDRNIKSFKLLEYYIDSLVGLDNWVEYMKKDSSGIIFLLRQKWNNSHVEDRKIRSAENRTKRLIKSNEYLDIDIQLLIERSKPNEDNIKRVLSILILDKLDTIREDMETTIFKISNHDFAMRYLIDAMEYEPRTLYAPNSTQIGISYEDFKGEILSGKWLKNIFKEQNTTYVTNLIRSVITGDDINVGKGFMEPYARWFIFEYVSILFDKYIEMLKRKTELFKKVSKGGFNQNYKTILNDKYMSVYLPHIASRINDIVYRTYKPIMIEFYKMIFRAFESTNGSPHIVREFSN